MDFTFSSLLAAFASSFTQDNRLFSLYFINDSLDTELLPHTLAGEEHISEPFQFTLECLSSNVDIELKLFIGQGVDIQIHRDDTDRVLSGIVTRAQQLSSDGGFVRYGLTVEPTLAILKLCKKSRAFHDKNVANIVGFILDEHIKANPVFAQCFRYRNNLTQNYSSRSYCPQCRESDFDFNSRLLREEGISYYFDFEHGGDQIGLQ